MANTLYSTTSTAWGGRNGHVASEDGRVDLNLSIPKSMGGDSLAGSPSTGLDLAARIEAEIPTLSHAEATELVEAAHAVCPYSRATRGNITAEVVAVES